jgi:hypothetical protein
MARPEAGAGDYNPEPYDKDAWQEFTPWRPGDAAVRDERSTDFAADGDYSSSRLPHGRTAAPGAARPSNSSTPGASHDNPKRGGRWWTEDVSPTYKPGDRVTNTRTARGTLFDHVQAGTKGHVDKVEKSLLGDDQVTVRFDNGYTETLNPNDIKPRSWWD